MSNIPYNIYINTLTFGTVTVTVTVLLSLELVTIDSMLLESSKTLRSNVSLFEVSRLEMSPLNCQY